MGKFQDTQRFFFVCGSGGRLGNEEIYLFINWICKFKVH